MDAANSGETGDPYLIRIWLAARINKRLGTNLLPWEFDDVPREWITAILEEDKFESYKKEQAAVKNYMDSIINRHPTFRKVH